MVQVDEPDIVILRLAYESHRHRWARVREVRRRVCSPERIALLSSKHGAVNSDRVRRPEPVLMIESRLAAHAGRRATHLAHATWQVQDVRRRAAHRSTLVESV